MMENLHYLPSQYMPSINTLSYKLLAVLADGEEHPKQELMNALEDDPRSALQSLRGESHGFWLIHNKGNPKGIYQLDNRHLFGERKIDYEARKQAEIEFRERSRKQAEQGTNRLSRAIEAETLAKSSMQNSFNFSNKKSEED